MNADECADRFEQGKGDIARVLGSDQELHFSNHTFDDINFQPVLDIILEKILRKTSSGAITVGARYTDELLEHIKEEIA